MFAGLFVAFLEISAKSLQIFVIMLIKVKVMRFVRCPGER